MDEVDTLKTKYPHIPDKYILFLVEFVDSYNNKILEAETLNPILIGLDDIEDFLRAYDVDNFEEE